MQALPSLQAVARLDERWQATEAGAFTPEVYQTTPTLPPTLHTFDLIYAGGGLGLLHAAVMACRYGYRVLLFDRGEVGCAHREWNISDHELRALVTIGLFTQPELEQVIMRRYTDGIVRFHPHHSGVRPAELHLPNVLNVALDAAGLLQLARRKLEAAGGTVLDQRAFKRVCVQAPGAVAVEVEHRDGSAEWYGAQVLVDGMGATSPLALRRFAGQPFAGVCPTVGTVVEGLEHGPAMDQHHPDVGDILVSISDTQRDRQLIWEGFAGRGDELTVYVFYYDLLKNKEQRNKGTGCPCRVPSGHGTRAQRNNEAGEQRNRETAEGRHSLLDLFEDYFRLLPTYKRPGANFRHLKPVYGFIPARHTQRRLTVPLLEGVLPIGDSSAQQSPLTFCGFGSHVRNLDRTTRLLDHALRRELLAPRYLGLISAYQANVALNWVFSRFMQPWHAPHDVNRLQNIFARVLNEVGVDVAVRFFQDQMTWRDYGRIVNHTLAIYKPIIPTALTVLGPRDTLRWIGDWLRFSAAATAATLGRTLGATRLDRLTDRIDRVRPGLAFHITARRAEWRAMGWETG
jgi:lycopene cyclase CruA